MQRSNGSKKANQSDNSNLPKQSGGKNSLDRKVKKSEYIKVTDLVSAQKSIQNQLEDHQNGLITDQHFKTQSFGLQTWASFEKMKIEESKIVPLIDMSMKNLRVEIHHKFMAFVQAVRWIINDDEKNEKINQIYNEKWNSSQLNLEDEKENLLKKIKKETGFSVIDNSSKEHEINFQNIKNLIINLPPSYVEKLEEFIKSRNYDIIVPEGKSKL
ncbi:MAG: hypothetical protein NTX65_12165 [Ignavibacteriales bacterium]|nr:hypothetical protein [Ignavibacteriales bacterium]